MNTGVTSQNLKLRLPDKNHKPELWNYVSRRIIQSGLGCRMNNITWTLEFGCQTKITNLDFGIIFWMNNMTQIRLPNK
ncbi:hypothetical protein RclHR1_21960002 [Rhizophagus clarus]|uniref:Uncharacterized protein n=1 Tax=Rhizophagus clarus TaxID=94130 RepID=A0A2Z6QVD4_9GLOM|nr:hypothetical protein RclHR1_21960002 [Rhizophagus clarus]